MTKLTKVQFPNISNILAATQEIAAVLGDYPCGAPDAKEYGHQFLIYSRDVWTSLPNVTADVVIDKPGAFTGNTHADRYNHEESIRIYNEKERHAKGTVRMLRYIFPPAVLLDLENNQGQIVGKTPREIIKHLRDTFCDDEQKEGEILEQELKLQVAYDPDDLPQVYFKKLQETRTILVWLGETVPDKKLIRQAISEFNKHADLHQALDEWKRKDPVDKTWDNLKTHITKAVVTFTKRSSTLKSIGIVSQVQEQITSNKENTEVVAQVQLEQARTIAELREEIKKLKEQRANAVQGAQTRLPLQEISPIQTLSQEALQGALGALLQMHQGGICKPVPKSGGKRPPRNDLPNGERSVRRYPGSKAYCWSCGYDLSEDHTSATCKWKKPGHKDNATFENKMGGSTRNCFHRKNE